MGLLHQTTLGCLAEAFYYDKLTFVTATHNSFTFGKWVGCPYTFERSDGL